MQPMIGLTASINENEIVLKRDSSDSISSAGGVPFIIPYTGQIEQDEQIEQICQFIDGLLLTGGEDIDPSWYGEEPLQELGQIVPERDRLEVLLAREMLRLNKPIFAICRGCQVLNVAAGGSLYQDIYTQCQTIQHRQKAPRSHLSHTVQIDEGTLLYKIMDTQNLKVNSFHH